MKNIGKNVELQNDSQRILDLLIVLILSPVWVPVMAVCAGLVWLGCPQAAIAYRQHRVGLHGELFPMWKFRSMVPNADELKHELRAQNERIWPDFKMTNDPRITRVGRWLRVTSLDELPQLLNVLRGDMSLVGPRPTSFSLSTYDSWHTERLEVRPGITGFWQVRSRNSDFDERVRMDILHVREFSVREAMILLLLTVPAALKGQ